MSTSKRPLDVIDLIDDGKRQKTDGGSFRRATASPSTPSPTATRTVPPQAIEVVDLLSDDDNDAREQRQERPSPKLDGNEPSTALTERSTQANCQSTTSLEVLASHQAELLPGKPDGLDLGQSILGERYGEKPERVAADQSDDEKLFVDQSLLAETPQSNATLAAAMQERPSISADVTVDTPASTAKTAKHHNKLGQIKLEDLLLLQMRDAKYKWPVIEAAMEKESGRPRVQDTLKRRENQVREALALAAVPSGLIDQATARDVRALAKINVQVDRKVGTSLDPAPRDRKRVRERRRVPNGVSANIASPDRDGKLTAQPSPMHRKTGGKSVSWSMLDAYAAAQAAAWSEYYEKEEEEGEVEGDDEDEPVDQGDETFYVYQVQRRECRNGDGTIDDAQWQNIGEPVPSISDANTAAAAKVLLLRRGLEPIVDPSKKFLLEGGQEGGLAWARYTSEVGIVETRVQQDLRTTLGGQAIDRSNWVPRAVFCARVRTEVKSVIDELFGEGQTVIVEDHILGAQVSADLDLINDLAIDHFLGATLPVKSAKLKEREQQLAIAKQDILEQIKANGDGTLFGADGTTPKGDFIKVRVEELKLTGPRNL